MALGPKGVPGGASLVVPVGFLEERHSALGSGCVEEALFLLVLPRARIHHPSNVPGEQGGELPVPGKPGTAQEVAHLQGP